MKLSGFPFWIALVLSGFCMALAANAADLPEIKARGELRHLGIRYANFVTGAGDGFDAELTQGFARHIGVKYRLVYSDFYSVIRDLLGKNVVREGDAVTLEGSYPIKGDRFRIYGSALARAGASLLGAHVPFPGDVDRASRLPHQTDHGQR